MAGGARREIFGSAATGLAAGALAVNLLLVLGLVVLVAAHGLGHFWQPELVEFELDDGTRLLGETWERQPLRSGGGARARIKVANRDLYGADFAWVDETRVVERRVPPDAGVFERLEWGSFFGYPHELRRGETLLASGADAVWERLPELLESKRELRERMRALERGEIDELNRALERLERAARRGEAVEVEREELQARFERAVGDLRALEAQLAAEELHARDASGSEAVISVGQIVRAIPANRLSDAQRIGVYASRVLEFLVDEPRESNTEGGIFPAIFGTVLMVLLTSLAVAPLGVLTALYLREYARPGPFVRIVRIAVHSLAGVPSIVFGVFGLGFFVYLVGGGIDALLFSDRLPTPTYGTGGILWASLTLALLTVPVVVVATEEGLAAVPRVVREGSLALGATRYETLRSVVLPAALPGVLTGLILAMARAAGEVAPLMIVGMVKLAPSLPFDSHFPFLHLERKFMHLGFHIYDVGFQSPNVEAVQPLVFATALLLIAVVVSTNLTAIVLRNRLRRKHAASGV
jgi:phosphate transport system permease protein